MMRLNGSDHQFMNWLGLLRIPNLAIIILTQYLLGYGIIRPLLAMQDVEPPLGHFLFFVLVLATVLIAAGGYIINDHFDVNTDRRNKPGKNMLEGRISVRKAFRLYYIINGIAVIAGFYLAWQAGSLQLGLIFPAVIGLLWFYSSRYQRMMLWGNLLVALLSAMVVLIVWLFEFFMLVGSSDDFVNVINQLGVINKYVWAYALFAFMLSLIREILKDIEDLKGDMSTGYRTLPVIRGIRAARIVAVILVILLMALLTLGQYYLFKKGLMIPFWYLTIAVQSILIYLLIQLIQQREAEKYGYLSITAKIIMVAGILSMELIYISF